MLSTLRRPPLRCPPTPLTRIRQPIARIATPISRLASTLPKLDLLALDRKWKQKWRDDPSSALQKSSHDSNGTPKPSSYILAMFPYPSGTLHMGHVRVYTISDVLARYKHMRGYDVLHPMGWDAFGLPAENAAIERGIDPAVWTEQNIANMKEQLRAIAAHFDWDRELKTCSPDFYKHTQKLFLMLREKGLAYQAKAVVNYDPVDNTVLANEQVDANGYSWRSGAKVEKRELTQWFLRITAFKEALLKDLDSLSGGWPERVLSQQRHWLGRSDGAKIRFALAAQNGSNQDVEVFTTRPDTLHGVQYLALSLTHPLVKEIAATNPELQKFIERAANLGPETKAGFRLPGVTAANPIARLEENSAVAEEVPVYVAPYVLSDYGEGAVMGVPGHDARDYAFWKENNPGSDVRYVVQPSAPNSTTPDASPFTEKGVLSASCGSYANLPSNEASAKLIADLSALTPSSSPDTPPLARSHSTWRLRDWLISRQRYWGAPIPIIHCPSCGPVNVPDSDLPVVLPQIDATALKGKPRNPLDDPETASWRTVACPSCGREDAQRDTDTMDTFVDSSWYALRFLDAHNTAQLFGKDKVRPVDTYVGGVEHAILHLLYAKFVYKFLATQTDLFPPEKRGEGEVHEPFTTLLSQGMVHGKTFTDPATGRFLKPDELDFSADAKNPVIKGREGPVRPNVSYEKMSKSKYNGVDPTACIERFGADSVRAHVLFSAPVSEVLEWEEGKIVGVQRWFGRVWKVVGESVGAVEGEVGKVVQVLGQVKTEDAIKQVLTDLHTQLPAIKDLTDAEADVLLVTHTTIASVSDCLENSPYGLNTVISDLTKFTNALASSPLTNVKEGAELSASSQKVLYVATTALLRLLAPIAPALAEECWSHLHAPLLSSSAAASGPSVFAAPWPAPILTPEQVSQLSTRGAQTTAVQINGKLRFSVEIPRFNGDGRDKEAEKEWVVNKVLETKEGKRWLVEKNEWEKRRKVVVVKGGRVLSVVF